MGEKRWVPEHLGKGPVCEFAACILMFLKWRTLSFQYGAGVGH